jgi:uncharacterized RDD family membrane protein YckC
MNWYYVEQGQRSGPVSDEQLDELVRGGKIRPDTLVWCEGMAGWTAYREAKSEQTSVPSGTNMPAEATPEAVCAECGKIFPIDETIRYGNVRVCAACKPVFLQKLSEGAAVNTGEFHYAGFWIRFAAKMLDGLILGLPFGIIFALMIPLIARSTEPTGLNFLPLAIQFGFIFIQMGYEIFFLGKYGATPGKMACRIKVVTSDGNKITYGRATGRFFSEMLSGMACYIGYIIVAFDEQKRALHDHICNTRVVYK